MHVNAFFGDDEIELCFPENWEVKECLMAGHNKPPLSNEDMRKALLNPVGTPRLSEMAKSKKEVCILFDDLPNDLEIDPEVSVYDAVPRAGNLLPGNARMSCSRRRRDPPDRLADDLEIAYDSVLRPSVGEERLAALGGVVQDAFDRLSDVIEVESLVSLGHRDQRARACRSTRSRIRG